MRPYGRGAAIAWDPDYTTAKPIKHPKRLDEPLFYLLSYCARPLPRQTKR